MLAQGFLDEMHAACAYGAICSQRTESSMRCVGYRQAWDWLDDA